MQIAELPRTAGEARFSMGRVRDPTAWFLLLRATAPLNGDVSLTVPRPRHPKGSVMLDLVDVLEAAYAPSIDEAAWLGGIASAAAGHLDSGVIALIYDASEEDWVRLRQVAAIGVHGRVLEGLTQVPSVRGIKSRSLAQLFREATFASVRDPHLSVAPAIRQYFTSIADQNGLSDIRFVNATNPTHVGCMLVALPRVRKLWSPREVHRWALLAAHIAAGLRVRESLARANERERRDTEAIPRPEGNGGRAEPAARGQLARAALRSSTVAYGRAREPHGRADRGAALAVWEGLVAGRWSLLDHVDAGGRRYVLARRNDPAAPDMRGLRLRERQVLTYVAMGHSNKLIAYHLGLTTSAVASHLAGARRKLRLPSASAIRDVLIAGDAVRGGASSAGGRRGARSDP